MLHWPTGATPAHTPHLLNVSALPYDWDSTATCPGFDKFLSEALPSKESCDALMEFIGLCFTSITRFQTMLWLFGDPRTGKGLIDRLITALTGKENTFMTTLAALADKFELQGAINKRVIKISETRGNPKFNDLTASLVKILGYVGEDRIAVSRKYMDPYVHGLNGKWIFSMNDAPNINDPSGAMVSRLLVLQTVGNYESKDDKLESKLEAELPGIAVKAIEALKRLIARGSFIQPEAGMEARQDIERASNPIARLLENDFVMGPDESCTRSEAHTVYLQFCFSEKFDRPMEEKRLGRAITRYLRQHGIGAKMDGARVDGKKVKIIYGCRPKTTADRQEFVSPEAAELLKKAAKLRQEMIDAEFGAGVAEAAYAREQAEKAEKAEKEQAAAAEKAP
jgi:putative DNA primase/helicase